MRTLVLTCAVMAGVGIVACSEDEATSPAAVSNDGGAGDAASPIADSGSDGGRTSIDDAGNEGNEGVCAPASDVAIPAAGKANAVAKLAKVSSDFNGTSADYAAVEASGTATTGGGFSNWTTTNGKTDATRRSVFLVLGTETPVECTTYPTPTPLVSLRYEEGAPAASRWNCTGGVNIDEVSGKSVKYHFTGACSPQAGGSNSAAGTFTLTGHGTATTLP